MSLPAGIEPYGDLSHCLVALAGEVLTCPACGKPQHVFLADAYGPYSGDWQIEPDYDPARPALRCACGAEYGRWSSRGSAEIHLGSGWRDLRGE